MAEFELNKIFELLMEQIPIGIIITDPKGDIKYINHMSEMVRDIKKEDLLGRNIRDCHQKCTSERVLRAQRHLKNNPGNHYTRMVEDQRAEKYYMNTYACICDETPECKGMVVLTNDITDQRRLEKEKANLERIQNETIQALKNQYHMLLIESMQSICKIQDAKDPYTKEHSAHVCEIALKMYEKRYGINFDYLNLQEAALLHDLGKLYVSDTILNKNGPLSEEEYAIVKKHAAIAFDILKPLDSGMNISKAVLHRHERYDGTGYPDGLAGTDIPEFSRIIAIADAYDAMSSDRPYRKGLLHDQCIEEIITQSGSQFDPEWVEIFKELASTGSI